MTVLWLVAGAAAAAGIGWFGALLLRRREVSPLRRQIGTLESQVAAGAADLRDTTARLQSIIDSAVDGIIVIDSRGLVEAFNPGAERLFGYAQSEVLGQNVSMLMPAPDRDAHDRYLARYLETGQARIIGIGREVTGRRRDGATFPLHLSVGEFRHAGERKFTGILHDLSRRVEAERQMREGAALAKVGEMAAVIAHEVKNPLAGVRGALQVLARRLPDPGDVEVLQEIVARLDSLDGLIKDLLLFARPVRLRLAPLDVTTLVAATVELISRDPVMRAVKVEVAGGPQVIDADAGILRTVFENLLLNAAQATGDGGEIRATVSTDRTHCEVAIADNGPGIPPDIRDKIFTPFFTTKVRGSGLGLATARRLVEAHGGEIRLDSSTTPGTTVRVRLPHARAGQVHQSG